MKYETSTTMDGPISRRPAAAQAARPAIFIRCRTCGRYLLLRAALERRYCGPTCAEVFLACPTCGRYFPAGGGYRGTHCSRECTVRFTLTRVFGPEPAMVVAEE